jgi:very-short-patch-repair endonuclease
MAGQLDVPPVDCRILALADRQHGVITWRQLAAAGLDDRAVTRRVRAGRLHRVHRGVYAVGHERLTMHGRFLAAVVSYGDLAVLSHMSAAILHGLRPGHGPRIDLTVPSGGGRARRGAIIVHRSPLPPMETTVRDAIPIIDLADVSTRRILERVIDEAAYLRLDLACLQPRPGRRGSGLLARVLAEHAPGSTRTRSDLEELMLSLCRSSGLPEPEVNRQIEGYLVDFVWRDARLIVETDGWQAHGTRSAFERDRIRDAHLIALGWRVVRITARRLAREPERVAAQLARLLGA